jgi:hypothetical protein
VAATAQDLQKRLAFVLHLGFVEIRSLALEGGHQERIACLADAMEILPKYLDGVDDEGMEMVRFVLTDYKNKFPESEFDYLRYLDGDEAPRWY